MAMSIIIQDEHGKQVEISVELDDDKNWEEKCHQIGCEVSREMAKLWMKDIEERLFHEKDKNMRSECFRKRIRVTRFGDFTLRRTYTYPQKLDHRLRWI